jgi:hypothetical protein
MATPLDRRSMWLAALVALVLSCAFSAFATKASANRSDCPPGYVCLWEGPTFGGNRAFFPWFDTGTHTLEEINPRSAFNNTGNSTVLFQGTATLYPSYFWSERGYYTGTIYIN